MRNRKAGYRNSALPGWSRCNGKFYSHCYACRTKVEGTEEPKLGGSGKQGRKDIQFRCSCGCQWHKDKRAIEHAIAGGYYNLRGNWIPCDRSGRPLKDSSGGVVKVRLR